MLKEHEPLKNPLAQDLILTHLGSFPLSPGVMSGHYATFDAYRTFNADALKGQSIITVFGSQPKPPHLEIPKGHFSINSPDGLNETVWKSCLMKAFGDSPSQPINEIIRDLIETNAKSDISYFDKRIQGGKSKLIGPPNQTPSLLKSFVFDGRFPFKTKFFDWMMQQMGEQIHFALSKKPSDDWSVAVNTLAEKWQQKYPEVPFAS